MPRLVVYGRSTPCPDMYRWMQWLSKHEVEVVEFDINHDAEAFRKVVEWTGHQSVPTLVIASDDGVDPVTAPTALPHGRGPRAVDRGTMLTEPGIGQVEGFLERNGIPFTTVEEAPRERRSWFGLR
ncbi:MAG: glutaredoxin family protein [Dehalococcoidia bacterium]